MLTESEALRLILDPLAPLPPVTLPLLDALGAHAAVPLLANRPSPPFGSSAMDGHALRHADIRHATPARPLRLPLAGEQPAGPDRRLVLPPGHAIRIFTGAPLPDGADTILMQEDATLGPDGALLLAHPPEPGEFIRPLGGDLATGQRILTPGQALTAPLLALLASQGHTTVQVHRRPAVALLATGDELVPPGQPLRPGQIHDTNTLLLSALLAPLRLTLHPLGIAPDQPGPLLDLIRRGLQLADILIITGGASVGDHDLVAPALARLGAPPALRRVAIKPGKPFLHAQLPSKSIFALPGNPVSAYCTLLLLVRPALLRLMGAPDHHLHLPRRPAIAGELLRNPSDRPHYLRGTLRPHDGHFLPSHPQESHALAALARSDTLALVPPRTDIPPGQPVTILPLPA